MKAIAEKLNEIRDQIEGQQVPTELFQDEAKTIVSAPQKSSEAGFSCELCMDTGWVVVLTGEVRRARRCQCRLQLIIERGLASIPPEFGVPLLGELQPRPDLHRDQPSVVDYMREHPAESYLLCGTNGTGKTHLGYALVTNALFAGRRVAACTVRELLAEFKRMELGEAGATGQAFVARVTPENLQAPREKWTIMLDEFEKARVTEFTSEMLFALVDAAWKYGHQLIVTSNMRSDGLQDRWSRIDEVYGRSIVKRLTATCNGIGFF